MGRKSKTQRVPRTRAGGEWTEAAFWGFLRSNLRLLSRKWPPRKHALLRARRPNESENKRLKWEIQCCDCKGWFPQKQVEVDHIVPCGSLSNWEEFRTFAERLLCETDGLEVRCMKCHQEKTNQKERKLMAGRPNYRVVAKSKSSGKFQDIAAFWIGDKGISGQLDRDIEKIVLSNGSVIKPDACWFNLQENRDEDASGSQESGGSTLYPGDGTPF